MPNSAKLYVHEFGFCTTGESVQCTLPPATFSQAKLGKNNYLLPSPQSKVTYFLSCRRKAKAYKAVQKVVQKNPHHRLVPFPSNPKRIFNRNPKIVFGTFHLSLAALLGRHYSHKPLLAQSGNKA
jgi:hypothetical protein